MEKTKKYWKGLEELNNTPEFQEHANKEFPEFLPAKEARNLENEAKDASRRDFLKLMGFSIAAASLAACETPTKYVIPYVNKPERLEPGNPNYYASSYVNGSEYCSIVVKTREGRPVGVQGNKLSPLTKGAVSTHATASLLSLYDSNRYKNFMVDGQKVSAKDADKKVVEGLKSAKGEIYLVSQTVMSPSTKAVIAEFLKAYPEAKHVAYDPISADALIKANQGVPYYHFDKADVIAGFNADFLGTWISPTEYAADYSENRKLRQGKHAKTTMSKHYQFETGLTVTGGKADKRVSMKPSEEGVLISALYNAIASKKGEPSVAVSGGSEVQLAAVKELAESLTKAKNKGLVVSGSNSSAVQVLVRKINEMIGAIGVTIDAEKVALYKQGSDDQMISFVESLDEGKVGAVLFLNANPVFDYKYSDILKAGLDKVATKVSFALSEDETSALCNIICPDFHYLESWGDVEPVTGMYSLIQPTITPIFDQPAKGWETRASQDSLLIWAGSSMSWDEFLKTQWKGLNSTGKVFEEFWFSALQDGVYEGSPSVQEPAVMENEVPVTEEVTAEEEPVSIPEEVLSLDAISKIINKAKDSSKNGGELFLYESVALGNGFFANNPWVQELPDPITKVTWDNYLAMAVSDAQEMGISQGDLVKVKVREKAMVKLPVVIQPGQAKGSYSVALGYGREVAGPLAAGILDKNKISAKAIGVDVYPFTSVMESQVQYFAGDVVIEKTGVSYPIAQTQTHQTLMARPIILETTLDKYQNEPDHALQDKDYQKITRLHTSKGVQHPSEIDVWKAPKTNSPEEYEKAGGYGSDEIITHEHPNHHWGLVIDLNTCTGCSACSMSCHAENNVPVVGKDEVLRRREMHWLRIDRYYSTDADTDERNISGYKEMEKPSPDNPKVYFQPMMCQHCNHAPCETVCPVAATTHSSEGLNQMTYNRCIGTRYCANNCPYKVRRFNWFNYADTTNSGREFPVTNYAGNDDLGKMVLNPDVVVRARGVMEKCSMCVQRIQAGKLVAKKEKRKVRDGEIETACASACPTDAIIFGDMNDPESRISKALGEENEDRKYQVLEELNVKPNVNYLAMVRNS